MAINPNILLQGRVGDAGTAVAQGIAGASRIQEMVRNKQLAPMQNRMLEAQAQQQEQGANLGEEQAKARRMLKFTQEAVNAYGTGGEQGYADYMDSRVTNLQNAGFSTDNTMEFHNEVGNPNYTPVQKYQAMQSLNAQTQQYAESIDAVKPMGGGVVGGMASAKTQFLSDGSAIFALPDGTVKVVLSDNTQLFGKDASEHIARIRAQDVEDKLSIKKRATEAAYDSKRGERALDSLPSLRGNMNDMDNAIKLLQTGKVKLGFLSNKLPNFRAESKALSNIKSRMGLDVIANGKFGALSETELKVAFETAMPEFNDPKEAIDWLTTRRNAIEKIYNNTQDLVSYLGAGGTMREYEAELKADEDKSKNSGSNKSNEVDIDNMSEADIDAQIKALQKEGF